jgi:integrase
MHVVNYRGKWCARATIDGKRRRWSLGNLDATKENRGAAERALRDLERSLAAPAGTTCDDIFNAYKADSQALDKARMENSWKALRPHFGHLRADQITRDICREYTAQRRQSGRQDGTIRRELITLRAALRWHDKNSPAVFDMPASPPPQERWLTRDEFTRLLDASTITYHLTLFLHLAIGTAGRKDALLNLTWHQVRFDSGEIWLGRKAGGKNRATVPMTKTLRAVLTQARELAQTEYVVEFAGRRVGSIKTAFNAACRRAKLADVTPHVLRHTAAVWMAGAGVPISKISQYLGHSDSRVTERVYARYQPGHLQDAAAALEITTGPR